MNIALFFLKKQNFIKEELKKFYHVQSAALLQAMLNTLKNLFNANYKLFPYLMVDAFYILIKKH